MPLNTGRLLARLLVIVVVPAVAAACGPAVGSAPAGSSAASIGWSGDASSSAEGAGSAAAAGSGEASTQVWLPDWADEPLPRAVANRRPLRFCGIEKPPAPQPMVYVDPIVRLCFRDAAENGEEAEWVSIQGTMEGGTVATVYRVMRDGTVELLTDWTQDPFGAGGWVRTICREVVDAEGDELVGVDGCDEGVPLP